VVAAGVLCATTPAGAQGLLDKLSRALNKLPGAQGQLPLGGTSRSNAVLDPITPAQRAKIDAALDHAPPSLRAEVAQARSTIAGYVAASSCVKDISSGMSPLQAYLGPDALSLNQIVAPLGGMRHHDAGSCLDVLRFQGWNRIALNEFGFQAVYIAADSGEAQTRQHIVHRQPDGAWLMRQ